MLAEGGRGDDDDARAVDVMSDTADSVFAVAEGLCEIPGASAIISLLLMSGFIELDTVLPLPNC